MERRTNDQDGFENPVAGGGLSGPVARVAARRSGDPAANLQACKQGRISCDRSRLTLSELTEVARADHARNVSDCRNAFASCDPSS